MVAHGKQRLADPQRAGRSTVVPPHWQGLIGRSTEKSRARVTFGYVFDPEATLNKSLRMRISYPAFVASACLAMAVQSSMAVGFGRLVNVTTLGQALDITVPVSVDPTEQITLDCVAAEVLVGDSLLPSPLLRLRLDPSPDSSVQWLRIHSRVPIVEPVVTVTVSAGCASRVSRQFVVFVDPPLSAADISVPTVVEAADTATAVAALKGATALSGASAGTGASKAQSRKATSRSQRRPARLPARASAQAIQATQITEARAERVPSRKSRRVASSPARLRTSASRLQLERGTPLAAAPALAAIASVPAVADVADVAASAVAMASAAASAASEVERAQAQERPQVAALQRRVEPFDTEVSNAAAAALQARSLAAQAPRYSLPWLLALTATVAVVLFGLGVLLDRRRLAQRSRPSTWRAEQSPTRPAASTLHSAPSTTMGSARATVPWADDGQPEALTSTGPLPFRRSAAPAAAEPTAVPPLSPVVKPLLTETAVASGNRARGEPVRLALPVTADALIDLEQQAEFFVALGQEDTAVDLLDGYSRGAGGACPLPYLLLLDLHHRRGDRVAHAAVCERYEKRFNRSSPVWGGQQTPTSSIADHPQEMRRIESVWREPLAAMRLVESLLVHGGTPTLAFDLHCLSELRFLYLLARDHSEIEPPPGEPAATERVDLLLPLVPSSPSPPPSPAAKSAPTATAVDFELDFMAPASPTRSK